MSQTTTPITVQAVRDVFTACGLGAVLVELVFDQPTAYRRQAMNNLLRAYAISLQLSGEDDDNI